MLSFRSVLFSRQRISLIISLIAVCNTSFLSAQTITYNNGFIDSLINNTVIEDSLDYNIKKWKALPLDQRFFVIDTIEFNRNQTATLIPKVRKYKDFVMSLKFYPDPDLKINFKPTLVNNQLLYQTEGYFAQPFNSNRNYFDTKPFSIKQKNQEIFITNPQLVKHIHKTIPEPHRLITDRKHLDKRSAEEGIRSLLTRDFNKPDKLKEKRKIKGPWTLKGVENIQLSQAYLENWTKGGENSVSLLSDLLLNANYKKDKNEWENYIRHKVGIISSESYATQINTDQIEMNSKYGMKASKRWYYSALFNFKTQFFNGYNNKNRDEQISGFMSPAYYTVSLGMDYKKDKTFTLLLSPLTAKLTYMKNTTDINPDKYIKNAREKGIRSKFSNGASIVNNINWVISTELSLISKLDAYISYFTKDEIQQVDWEVIFNMRVNRFLSTRINTQLRYFNNESDKIQLKENFTISFNYKF